MFLLEFAKYFHIHNIIWSTRLAEVHKIVCEYEQIP